MYKAVFHGNDAHLLHMENASFEAEGAELNVWVTGTRIAALVASLILA